MGNVCSSLSTLSPAPPWHKRARRALVLAIVLAARAQSLCLDEWNTRNPVQRNEHQHGSEQGQRPDRPRRPDRQEHVGEPVQLSLIHISEPTRLLSISYAV